MNANELADNFDTIGRFGDWAQQAQAMLREQAKEIEQLKPYKKQIEIMEQAYDAHIKKSMGEVKDLIKKASEK